jgi:hypothetical protein
VNAPLTDGADATSAFGGKADINRT